MRESKKKSHYRDSLGAQTVPVVAEEIFISSACLQLVSAVAYIQPVTMTSHYPHVPLKAKQNKTNNPGLYSAPVPTLLVLRSSAPSTLALRPEIILHPTSTVPVDPTAYTYTFFILNNTYTF
jgi:hypothetical protein